jgi:hypothetical protein
VMTKPSWRAASWTSSSVRSCSSRMVIAFIRII